MPIIFSTEAMIDDLEVASFTRLTHQVRLRGGKEEYEFDTTGLNLQNVLIQSQKFFDELENASFIPSHIKYISVVGGNINLVARG